MEKKIKDTGVAGGKFEDLDAEHMDQIQGQGDGDMNSETLATIAASFVTGVTATISIITAKK